MKILGIVKNLKKEGKVKVLCQANDEIIANDFFNRIMKIDNPLIFGKIDELKSYKIKIKYEPENKAPQFSDFQIEREDELTEMVWALQGAGKVFALQEEIGEQKRKIALNWALKHGLTEISDCVNELQTSKNSKRTFMLLAIENYLKECPVKDGGIIANLYDLHQFCVQSNKLVCIEQDSQQEAELAEILVRILKLCSKIEESLEKV